jgi:uncharacterized protein involved in exopolysaccharide biosynthesis
MKHKRLVPAAAAILCLALSVSAGWLWHALSERTYEARARLALPGDPFAGSASSLGGDSQAGEEAAEETVLAPAVLSAAADLLHERGVHLSLPSPFDSETDYLLGRLRVEPADRGTTDEVGISCTAPDAEEALQIVQAIVDACQAAASGAHPAATDSATDDAELERRQLVRAIERQERAIARLVEQIGMASESPRRAAGPGDHPLGLEGSLEEARRAVSEAERRLEESRRDFARKMPAETVAARLPDGPVRSRIIQRLNLARLKEESRQQQALAERLASVYGRNHPRMTELREKIEQLQKQISAIAAEANDIAAAAQDVAPAALVLNELEIQLAEARTAEAEIDRRTISRNERFGARQELEAALGDARQELAFLHGEHDRVRRQIDNSRREQTHLAATVIEPPLLSPDPIAPRAGLQMAVSCVAGMALYLLLLWQLRSRFLAPAELAESRLGPAPFARAPVQGTAHSLALAPPLVQIPDLPVSTLRPDRNRSQDEERLARLKMLSSRGKTAIQWQAVE